MKTNKEKFLSLVSDTDPEKTIKKNKWRIANREQIRKEQEEQLKNQSMKDKPTHKEDLTLEDFDGILDDLSSYKGSKEYIMIIYGTEEQMDKTLKQIDDQLKWRNYKRKN